MKYFEKIKGDRVYLSPLNSEDYEIYAKWMNDEVVTGNLGNDNCVYTIPMEKAYLENNPGTYNFSIILREDDRLIGNIGLLAPDYINRTASISIYVGEKEDRNKGYGREAIKLLLNYGFNTLNLNNIMLSVFSYNEKAIKTYKKLGFKTFGVRKASRYYQGNLYDTVYMEILKDEFNEIEDFIFVS